ncbi:MAG: citrate/2-methylcitrate synthase [Clostridia bacterium]|nr:citrate/2-methylcitrate synthase [Clostridia bacterium]
MNSEQKQNHLDALTNLFYESKANEKIDPALFGRYSVKRGLRNENGTGVLVGLTDVGEVFSYYIVDGERLPAEGKLFYRGISLNDIVHNFWTEQRFGFEEVCYLLLYGDLPSAADLALFQDTLGGLRTLPPSFVEDTLFKTPSRDVMNKLARSVLGLYATDEQADDISKSNVLRQSLEMIARFPLLISYAHMAKRHYIDGESLFIHAPDPKLSTAQNILRLIRPDGQYTENEARVLDLAMVVQAEHGGGNNSTFTCRCVTSTGTDSYSAIAAAIGSLKGPQHGGAASKTFRMMQDLKENVSNWRDEYDLSNYLRALVNKQAFDKSGLIYGIGHAVYTVSDPRTQLLRDYARGLAYEAGREAEYDLYLLTERLAPQILREEKRQDKPICANVDFYTGFIYDLLGIPSDLFTSIFAAARVPGWCAHRMEELISGGRIIRPAYKSVQPRRLYTPMSERE